MTSRAFFHGGGEAGALMRSLDWSRTQLGPVSAWPQSLLTSVGICLHSRFPILIWWGPQFVKLYNDAYRQLLGRKHPHAMGAPGHDVWPEIWHIIGPMLESVVRDGRATWSEDQMLPLERHGYPEECYFTFSYSPIHDESGSVGGVFCAVTETTGRVIGERRLRLLQELAAESAAETADAVCAQALAVLARDASDLPFAALYLQTDGDAPLRFAGATGIVSPLPADDGAFGAVLDSRSIAVVPVGASQRPAFLIPIGRPDGSAAGLLVAGISPHLAADEQYRGFAALLGREIGAALAQARALEDEKRRAAALAEIDRVKTAFFSNVSHEFRTPLTLMLGPIEDALESSESGLVSADLVTVHRNALRLLKLVNTMLDFARIEAGRMQAVFEPTDLAQLTTDLASAFRSAMARAGLRYEVDCATLAAPVYVDRDLWEKIVLNLISNALKFTLRGVVHVSLRERDGRAELEVSDSGVGIAAADLPQLFTRFHRIHGTEARTHEGSGIGLALVNELVKMHGGHLAVASEPGVGSRFTVSVPMGDAHLLPEATRHARPVAPAAIAAKPYVEEALRWMPASADVAPASDAARSDRGAILVVDDNADMREYLARLLGDRWPVETAADGGEALEKIARNPPALVITDVMMPRVDGFELLRALRTQVATRDLPVIMLSARAGEEAKIEGLEAGADDYLVKPFSAREVRARIEAQLLRAEIRSIAAAHDRRLADIFRDAPVAIAILRGSDFVFEFLNEPYAALIGHRPVLGRRFRDALPELESDHVFTLLDEAYRTGEPVVGESLRLTLGPTERFFSFVCQPMRGADGGVDGLALVITEVTDLVAARREAEAANAAKDEFLALLGHELRNPLAPILTAIRLLDVKGPSDSSLHRLRDVIHRQSMQMARLVEDLLDVGRIITGKLVLEKQRIELAPLVRQAVEASMPLIERHQHSLSITVDEEPMFIDADSARLVQVICNLLNNAAKYMAEGGRIDLAVTNEQGTAVVRVRDRGIGIDPAMQERIFERFVQVIPTGRRSEGGLGLGLALVKAIVEAHGGRVGVQSDGVGLGSEFFVALPVAVAAPPQPA